MSVMANKFVCATAFILFPAIASMASGQNTNSGASAFVRAIYAPYTSDTYSSLGPNLKKVFSPKLSSLIEVSDKTDPLDFDPLCDCQDNDDLKLLNVEISRVGSEITNADVRLQVMKSSPNVTTLRLRLVHLPDGWRVDDVAWPQRPSLRELLTRKSR
jgi:hypothetical protein